MQCTYNVTLRCVCATIVAVKTMSIACSVSAFVALDIQHVMHMHCIAVCGLPCCTILFCIISKRQNFRKKKITEYKMCVLIFSTTFV
jgi:hypothetical protein